MFTRLGFFFWTEMAVIFFILKADSQDFRLF